MYPNCAWLGPMWFFPMVVPIIMLIAMVLCLYFFFGRGGGRPPLPPGGPESESALEILKKRYARGEINKEEYEQVKRDILT